MNLSKSDYKAIAIIFLYCLLFAGLRLGLSDSLSPDEAEQFWDGSYFAWGYPMQPPLYSWIVYFCSLVFGNSAELIVIIKYIILFSFYLSFYYIARHFWNAKHSLLITSTLLLFPSHTYDFVFDMTHTIIVTALASISLLLYIRILINQKASNYYLLGICLGLGMLSKYNFILFALAVMFATLSTSYGRKILLNLKSLVAIVLSVAVSAPHALWLVANDFPPFKHALDAGDAGDLVAANWFFALLKGYFPQFILFTAIFAILLYPALKFSGAKFADEQRFITDEEQSKELIKLLRLSALFSFIVPIVFLIVLKTGKIHPRWFTTVYFLLVPAFFSFVDLSKIKIRKAMLASLPVLAIVAVTGVKVVIGYYPDLAGKVKRTNVPYKAIAAKLSERIEAAGLGKIEDLTIISDHRRVAANFKAVFPETKVLYLTEITNLEKIKAENPKIILLWDLIKYGRKLPVITDALKTNFPNAEVQKPLKAPYLKANKLKPYKVGLAIVSQ